MADNVLIKCAKCRATNRVRPESVGQGSAVICGRCKTPLDVSNAPVAVTDANFSTTVQSSPLPVLLDMWAAWCPPCRMIAPTIDQLAAEMAGRVRVGKLNVDENPMTAARFNVSSIPTLLVLKGGREIDRIVGVQPKAEIARRLERAIA